MSLQPIQIHIFLSYVFLSSAKLTATADMQTVFVMAFLLPVLYQVLGKQVPVPVPVHEAQVPVPVSTSTSCPSTSTGTSTELILSTSHYVMRHKVTYVVYRRFNKH